MNKVNSLLSERLKTKERPKKMKSLASKSAEGGLSSFAGLFGSADLSPSEREKLEDLLTRYSGEGEDISDDLRSLVGITSEVKAINNQAAILHGERIKKAQQLFKGYREGAFSAWLMATYGNRQTPYNFLQYYEFYRVLPEGQKSLLEDVPRQAVYTLASRDGDVGSKVRFLEECKGLTKDRILQGIRESFPLSSEDGRRQKMESVLLTGLQKLHRQVKGKRMKLSSSQKEACRAMIEDLENLIS